MGIDMARIMITEDEILIAEDLKQTLQELGHSVVGIVASGENAVTLAMRMKPDIIFMDIKLAGELNGIETAKTIARQLDVSIIFCSAYNDNDTLLRASAVNPLAYIAKPYDKSEIKKTLDSRAS